MARRSPWINERAQLLVRLLAECGLEVSGDVARADISDHVDHVAARMRIGRQAAKAYVTDEVIAEMADRIAREVQRQQTRQALDPKARLRIVPPPPD